MKTFMKHNALALCKLAIAIALITNVPAVFAQLECNSLGPPLVTTGSITTSDPAQTQRLFRVTGNNTTCLLQRPLAGNPISATINFDQYTFTNTTSGPICVYVDLDARGCGEATNQISMAAYSGTYNPNNVTANLIAEPGGSTGQNFSNSMSFTVAAGATYTIVVHSINNASTCASYTFRRYETNNCRAPGYDAANDGNADLALFRPSGNLATWHSTTLTGNSENTQFGSAGDIPVPGDYIGSEVTRPAVFRPSNATWYTNANPIGNYGARRWGLTGDIPAQGDYDRDGITDLAVFRPTDGNYYVLLSSDSTMLVVLTGASGDKVVQADYDGDGKTDPAIFRPSNGLWQIFQSGGNYGSVAQQLFGLSTDIPVPADYDGDGKADIAVFRPSNGNWYILRSSVTTGQLQVVNFGANGDIPQPADYDGDRKADQAVFRPSNNTWYINRSTAGFFARMYGQTGDIPVSSPLKIP